MKKQSVLFVVIGVLIGVILMGVAAVSLVNNQNLGMRQSRGIGSNVDRNFIEQMIPHHEGAIEMAKQAQQKSNRSEIKTLAGNIITSQADEISKMQSWYKQWYAQDVPEGADSNRMGSMMHNNWDAESLNEATDFDKAFLEQMIPHHQMAVMMATMLKNGTDRQEMKTLAGDIIATQSKEIAMMQDWQIEWKYVTSE